MMITMSSNHFNNEKFECPALPNSKSGALAIACGSIDCDHYRLSLHVDHSCHRWRQRAGDALWLASSIFILYFGDLRTNFFAILANDPRICREALHIGSICLLVDFFLLFSLAMSMQRSQEKRETVIINSIQVPTILGLLAFILYSIALWPIWNVLTLPLLFTLFMTLVVVLPYALPYMDMKMDPESLQYLYIKP